SGWGAASAPHYHHFRKIILPTSRGSCEIDHLIVSPFGLFVIESKDRSGWIFGEESERNWTAVHFKNKYTFQNPLHQNYGRMKAGFFAAVDHAASVRNKYRSTTTCPKCGGELVPRVAKTGPMPGSRFLGCSNYPTCKYVRNLVAT